MACVDKPAGRVLDPSIEATADGNIVTYPLAQGLCPRYDCFSKLAKMSNADPDTVATARLLREVATLTPVPDAAQQTIACTERCCF
jgi:hypothetical protein